MSSTLCRLCSGSTRQLFTKVVLGKYDVGFHECTDCESLQTDEPYWLEETYKDGIRILDTYAAERAQIMQRVTYLVGKMHSLSRGGKVLDWGAGDGLLVRMMRDVGLNAYHWDPYERNTYASGFDGDIKEAYEMVTAFEVWEHLPDPANELGRIFAVQPLIHLATTSLYNRQGPDWSYLNTLTGRHVFFYSRTAVEQLAKKFNYIVDIYQNSLLLFYRPPKLLGWRGKSERYLLSNRQSKLFQTLFAIKKKYGFQQSDHEKMASLMLANQKLQ